MESGENPVEWIVPTHHGWGGGQNGGFKELILRASTNSELLSISFSFVLVLLKKIVQHYSLSVVDNPMRIFSFTIVITRIDVLSLEHTTCL